MRKKMKVRIWSLAFLLSLVAAAPAPAQKRECLSYEPGEVKLTGRLIKKTFPGPPNYRSIRRGDRPERIWVLRLARSVCVTGNADDYNVPERRVNDLQFILSDEEYRRLSALGGRGARVTVTGQLTHQQTAHHFTPVLIVVSDIKRIN